MWNFVVILQLCFIVGNAYKIEVPNCGKSFYTEGRILGGFPLKPGDFPWMVTQHFRHENGSILHQCGGTILNHRWIVTAAHCITSPNATDYEIYVGVENIWDKSTKHVRMHNITKVIAHEGYNTTTLHNDIALMKTADPIDFSGSEGYVNGICLPRRNEKIPTQEVMIAGWGKTEESKLNHSDILLAVKIPIISRKICDTAYKSLENVTWDDVVSKNMLCAGTAGLDACQFDSGGPLVGFRNDRAKLYGIVSFGNGCGRADYPGVYTKVSSYVGWIKKTILSNKS